MLVLHGSEQRKRARSLPETITGKRDPAEKVALTVGDVSGLLLRRSNDHVQRHEVILPRMRIPRGRCALPLEQALRAPGRCRLDQRLLQPVVELRRVLAPASGAEEAAQVVIAAAAADDE